MIKSIDIKNFETHLDTSITLHKGVNTFVGESDEGKSGIIRAIKWNTKNRPQGDAYRNDQLTKKDKKKFVQVKVNYKQTGIVLRERNDSGKNHYVINNGEPLRALRTDVPQEVKDVTQMKDVNIQGQHPTEQYFLLADKPGQVAKKLNEVAGLTVMDKAMSEINSQVRSTNSELKLIKKEIETNETKLKKSDWVPKAVVFANKLKKFKTKLENKSTKIQQLSHAITQLEIVNEKLQHFKGIEKALMEITEHEKLFTKIKIIETQKQTLENNISMLKSIDLEIKSSHSTKNALNTLKQLEKLQQSISANEKETENLKKMLSRIDYSNKQYLIAEMELDKITKEFNEMIKTTECPVCGRRN